MDADVKKYTVETFSKDAKMVMRSEPPKTSTAPAKPDILASDCAFYQPAALRGEGSPVRYTDTWNRLEAETGEEVHQAAPGSNHRESSTNYRFEMRRSKPKPSVRRERDAYPDLSGTEAAGSGAEPPSDDDKAYKDPLHKPGRPSKLRASRLNTENQPGPVSGPGSNGEELVMKGGFRYLLTTSPSLIPGPPSTAQDGASGPYHLHPQDGTGGTRGDQDRSGVLLLPPGASQTPGRRDAAVQWQSSCGDTRENDRVLDQPRRNTPETQGVADGKPPGNTSKFKTPPLVNTEDIVERNKITLGRKPTQCGSYLRAHAPKQETDDMAWWEDPREEEEEEVMVHGADRLVEEGFHQDLRWLQNTQQLKAHWSSRKDGPPQERVANLQGPTRVPRPGAAIDRPGPRHRRPPGDTAGIVTRPKAPKDLSLQSTPSEALPPISSSYDYARSQTPVTSPSPSGHGWEEAPSSMGESTGLSTQADSLVGCSDVRALWRPGRGGGGPGRVAPAYPQPRRGKPPLGLQNKPTLVGRAQRAKEPSRPPSYDPEHFLIQDEDKDDLLTQDGLWVAGELQIWRSGSHLVLPPIGADGHLRGAKPSRRSGSISPARRSSEPACVGSYLAQVERQKQLKEGAGYKVYTLKDYRQLRHVGNLCGLGPDQADEKTAEKIRRQRLYSNGIQERNKKKSPGPRLPARDPEDEGKTVPRRKALEYAKTITKPHPKPQPKKPQDQSEGGPGPLGSAHLEVLDQAQLQALEDMTRRHELEKRTVASFQKAHVL